MIWSKAKYKIKKQQKLALNGIIVQLAGTQDGFVYAIIRPKESRKYYEQTLIGISIESGVLWEYESTLYHPKDLRVNTNGEACVCHGKELLVVNKSGELIQNIAIEMEEKQQVGSFAIVDGGYIVCVECDFNNPKAKVVRITIDGDELWSTPIPINDVAYKGLVHMGVDTNWEIEESPPHEVENWVSLYRRGVVVSDDRVLVNYFEFPRTGVGQSFCLDLYSGELLWVTPPSPFHIVIPLSDARFMISHYGYGAFETELYDRDGKIVNEWNTVGYMIVDEQGKMLCLSLKNQETGKTEVVELEDGGGMSSLFKLVDNEGAYPIIDDLGNLIFSNGGAN